MNKPNESVVSGCCEKCEGKGTIPTMPDFGNAMHYCSCHTQQNTCEAGRWCTECVGSLSDKKRPELTDRGCKHYISSQPSTTEERSEEVPAPHECRVCGYNHSPCCDSDLQSQCCEIPCEQGKDVDCDCYCHISAKFSAQSSGEKECFCPDADGNYIGHIHTEVSGWRDLLEQIDFVWLDIAKGILSPKLQEAIELIREQARNEGYEKGVEDGKEIERYGSIGGREKSTLV